MASPLRGVAQPGIAHLLGEQVVVSSTLTTPIEIHSAWASPVKPHALGACYPWFKSRRTDKI